LAVLSIPRPDFVNLIMKCDRAGPREAHRAGKCLS
jgi:hypothetical protein